MLAHVEESVPEHDFGVFCKNPPEFHKVSVGGALAFQGGLNVSIEFGVTVAGTLEVDAHLLSCLLVILAKAGHAGRSDRLGVTGAKRVQERAIAFVEEKDAINVIRFAQISGQAGPESAHVGMEEAERA